MKVFLNKVEGVKKSTPAAEPPSFEDTEVSQASTNFKRLIYSTSVNSSQQLPTNNMSSTFLQPGWSWSLPMNLLLQYRSTHTWALECSQSWLQYCRNQLWIRITLPTIVRYQISHSYRNRWSALHIIKSWNIPIWITCSSVRISQKPADRPISCSTCVVWCLHSSRQGLGHTSMIRRSQCRARHCR